MQQAFTPSMQSPAIHTRLHRYALFPVRVLWLAMTFITLGLFIAGLTKRY